MRIVIADDEYLIQESLISMISELSQTWNIVGTASDGREMMELIRNEQPDLAIVDIKMPYLSGIEAIQLIRNEYPKMKWIVLTGYSEFSFAQDAIRLGASNYLLKPVDQAELALSLSDIELALLTQNDGMNVKFGSRMTDICHGLVVDDGLEDSAEQKITDFHLFVFYVDSGLEESLKSSRLSSFYKQMRERIGSRLQGHSKIRYSFIFLPSGELALITESNEPNITRLMGKVALDMEQVMQEAVIGNEFCLTMLTAQCHSYSGVKEQLDGLQRVSVMRIGYGMNRRWHLQDWVKGTDEEHLQLCKCVEKLVKHYEESSYALYINAISECRERFEKMCHDQQHRKVKSMISQYLSSTIGCRLDVKETADVWIKQLKEHGQLLLSVHIPKMQRPQDTVQQTLLFIEKSYMNEISILQIADELKVTPNYLSTIFHKKMGTTFIKYLTNIRLKKSQELLKDPHVQVQKVAEMVGYSNPRYFAKLFTDQYGCNPSDYRRTL
ncbi:response regulator transcription factor [Paenibacillus sp. Soil750]|uniref:response regulator transcription factor n=1 Tax=Paenibacillus sp. Soil750 TaxID=1736398 RepID=UPI0006FD572F|nr:response regulator [Paenibacillus sp. Soil750]KRE69739.1 hypothetical protein ASL11_15350 [Paenibacillus sp. Soil750]